MSHSDRLKDQLDVLDEVSAPAAEAKAPLGFEQEVAPADPSLVGRRLFLKLSLFGAAAAMAPEALRAALQGGTASAPVILPYKNSLSFLNQPATLSDDKGPESTYLVTGGGNLYIDAGGNVFLTDIQAKGTFASGSLDVGPISIVQPAASLAGQYVGTTVNAGTTVLFSDQDVQQQPATLKVQGDLRQGGGDLTVGVSFQSVSRPGSDVGVVVGWSKATC